MSLIEKTEETIGKIFIMFISLLAVLASANAEETPKVAKASIEEIKANPERYLEASDLIALKTYMIENGLRSGVSDQEAIYMLDEQILNSFKQTAGAREEAPGPNCAC